MIITRATGKKITKKYITKGLVRKLKGHTRTYLFNTKEGSVEGIEEEKKSDM